MSGRRFGSWPSFNGKKVVLEDDARLAGSSGTPTSVAQDAVYTVSGDQQALAFLPIRVDGTLVVNGSLVNL